MLTRDSMLQQRRAPPASDRRWPPYDSYRSVLGIDADGFDNEDKFLLHLSQMTRNMLGDRAGTCIDPRIQLVEGKAVCLVSCQRSPEPVYLKTKSMPEGLAGDFYVRSGPGTIKLDPENAAEYIRTRFPLAAA